MLTDEQILAKAADILENLDEKFSKSERSKRKKKCDNPKGFTMKQFCKNQRSRSKKGERKNEEVEFLQEKCWEGYKQVGLKKKGNRMVPNCVPVNEKVLREVTEDEMRVLEDVLDDLNPTHLQALASRLR